MTVAGLLLAAGAGTRLGRPKALVAVGGTTLLARGVAMLVDAGCEPVVVVLGADAAEVRRQIEPPTVPVVADDWADGQGASLRAGLDVLADTTADAVVITLVDEPLLTAAAVTKLISESGDAAAAVANYAGVPGHPVLLRRSVWDDVALMAQGDVGARAWLRAHPDLVAQVSCDGLGRPDDIDTDDDLVRLLAAEQQQAE